MPRVSPTFILYLYTHLNVIFFSVVYLRDRLVIYTIWTFWVVRRRGAQIKKLLVFRYGSYRLTNDDITLVPTVLSTIKNPATALIYLSDNNYVLKTFFCLHRFKAATLKMRQGETRTNAGGLV